MTSCEKQLFTFKLYLEFIYDNFVSLLFLFKLNIIFSSFCNGKERKYVELNFYYFLFQCEIYDSRKCSKYQSLNIIGFIERCCCDSINTLGEFNMHWTYISSIRLHYNHLVWYEVYH